MQKSFKFVTACFIIVLAITLFSFSKSDSHSTATVIQAQGLYVFIKSTPVAEYTVLGTVKKTGLVLTGSPTEMYNTILRRAKKSYPEADGIIFDEIDMEHATCIKFK